jgi:hypothetical protein
MYRIELSPGEETVFRSIEELAVAIKRGVVTPRARIYHNASSKWLPIQFHPHYKAAVSMPLTQAALVAGPPIKQLSTLSLQQPADPEPPAPILAPAPVPAPAPAPIMRLAAAVEPLVRKRKSRPAQPAAEKRSRRQSKPRRQLRIALVGALLVGGAQWVLSAPLFSRTDAPALLRVQRHLIASQAEAMKRVSLPNTAAMVPVIRNPAAPAPASLGGSVVPQPAVVSPLPAAMTPALESAATPEIEPAPSTSDLSAPPALKADPLGSRMVDSTNKKAIKGILRAVSGTPTKEKAPAKR